MKPPLPKVFSEAFYIYMQINTTSAKNTNYMFLLDKGLFR